MQVHVLILSILICIHSLFYFVLLLLQYAIDDSLPFILNILLAQLFAIAGSLVVTVYGLPWMVLLLLPLGVFYYQIQHYYRRTSRYTHTHTHTHTHSHACTHSHTHTLTCMHTRTHRLERPLINFEIYVHTHTGSSKDCLQ